MEHKLNNNIERKSSTFKTMISLWTYLWTKDRADLKRRVLFAIFCMVTAKVVLLAVPYIYKYSTNSLIKVDSGYFCAHPKMIWISMPIILILSYNSARLLQASLNQVRDSLFARVSQHVVRKLALKSFRHIHRLSLRFHLERRTGGLSRIIERAVKSIETIVRMLILNTIPTIIEFVFAAIAFCYSYSFSYFAIVAAMVVIYVWFSVVTSNKRIDIRRNMNSADTKANSHAVDALLNYETVKYFGNEELEANRFDAAMANYETAAVKMWTSLSWLNFGQAFILSCGMLTIMILSAHEIMMGRQTIGDFVFVSNLLIQLSIPLNFIGSLYREIRQGVTDVEALFNLLEVHPEITDVSGATELNISNADISFKNVSFTYEHDREIIKDISFDVKGGKILAIVGTTGSGKSTILRLLFRFYDVTKGAIFIDNQDISKVTQHSLRSHIAVVPQDTVLFNDTIAYNIGYGKMSASREEIEAAAKSAQIHDFISKLPLGYETMVGERGLKLSGGEKQRIAIARAILKAPRILLLDEATSALDTHTELEIQEALGMLSKGRTTIVIAHRLSTIIDADEILVLREGKIVERGTHSGLLDKKGAYYQMWETQKKVRNAQETIEQNENY